MRHESIFTQISHDWRACFERDPAARNWLEVLLCYSGFHAIVAYRFIHPLHRWGVPVLPRCLSQYVRFLTGVEIHPGAKIGTGCFIDHGMGVVIGETSEIGRNCTLYQGVTLGGTSLQRGKRHPTLGDDIVVGAGAKIIGAIEVGSRAKIAAGAVVVKDVPPNSTVVGVPGHVVLQDGMKVVEAVIPHVDMPDPEDEAIQALARRIDALEAKTRSEEQYGGPRL
ncbi:MAG TPA: serine O-acetyltransferase [Candidatus Eremiobacteraceae bacterium]|nr:serine O-acetyltransferase [Candidatus Eremiobacteraceae bacterium]